MRATEIRTWSSALCTGSGEKDLLARLDSRSFISLHHYGLVLGRSKVERLRWQCGITSIKDGASFLIEHSESWLDVVRGVVAALDCQPPDQVVRRTDRQRSVAQCYWSVVRISTDMYSVDIGGQDDTTSDSTPLAKAVTTRTLVQRKKLKNIGSSANLQRFDMLHWDVRKPASSTTRPESKTKRESSLT